MTCSAWSCCSSAPGARDGSCWRTSRIRRQSVIGEPDSPAGSAISIATLAHLPIGTGAVDAVLLPHTLEIRSRPLCGAARGGSGAWSAEGQLIVLGFRPASFWGLRAAASRCGLSAGPAAHCSRHGGCATGCVLLSYEVVSVRPTCIACRASRSSPLEAAVSSMLRRGWFYPWPAGAYVLKARKRVYALTPVRPRLRERRAVIGGLVEPGF